MNTTTREVFAPSDIIHAVYSPAAAASLNRLVVCGGLQSHGHSKHCQLYSPKDDRCAICKYSSVPLVICGFQSVGVLTTVAVLYKHTLQTLVIMVPCTGTSMHNIVVTIYIMPQSYGYSLKPILKQNTTTTSNPGSIRLPCVCECIRKLKVIVF